MICEKKPFRREVRCSHGSAEVRHNVGELCLKGSLHELSPLLFETLFQAQIVRVVSTLTLALCYVQRMEPESVVLSNALTPALVFVG